MRPRGLVFGLATAQCYTRICSTIAACTTAPPWQFSKLSLAPGFGQRVLTAKQMKYFGRHFVLAVNRPKDWRKPFTPLQNICNCYDCTLPVRPVAEYCIACLSSPGAHAIMTVLAPFAARDCSTCHGVSGLETAVLVVSLAWACYNVSVWIRGWIESVRRWYNIVQLLRRTASNRRRHCCPILIHARQPLLA